MRREKEREREINSVGRFVVWRKATGGGKSTNEASD